MRIARLLCSCLSLFAVVSGFAQTSTFTYQGRFTDGTGAANGVYDFRFRLAADAQGNSYVGSTVLTNGVAVSGGTFTVGLDFGAGLFSGSNYWLEVAIKTNGAASYTVLAPLQALTSTPYAIFAGGASNAVNATVAASANSVLAGNVSGTLSLSQLPGAVVTNNATGLNLAGTFAGDGASVTNVNATALNGLNATSFWQLGGNNVTAGQFIGSTNNQPVEIWVNNQRALRLAPATQGISVVHGSTNNSIDSTSSFGTIGGGENNVIEGSSNDGTIAGGYTNVIQVDALNATIGGGVGNTIGVHANGGTVGGGLQNTLSANAAGSTISGGGNNSISGLSATIPGGANNLASGAYTFAAGQQAQALHQGSFVWSDSQGSAFASTANDQFNVRAQGGARFVTGGAGMSIDGQPVLASSGISIRQNTNGAPNVIEGSQSNTVSSGVSGATIGGGGATNNMSEAGLSGSFSGYNSVSADFGTVGGGIKNTATGIFATVAGGVGNNASGTASFIGGGGIDPYINSINGNKATGIGSVVSGGTVNTAGNNFASVGGGYNNIASGDSSTIGGGFLNTASDLDATVSGGVRNSATAYGSVVCGGAGNKATNGYAVVAGGFTNVAGGIYSFAAGYGAQALHGGAFVWADSEGIPFTSTANNQFLIRATGGVGVNTNNPNGAALNVAGAIVGTSFSGDGSSLLNLNASQLASGTVPSGRLSGTYSSAVTLNNAANSYSGSGANLTSLNANNLASGTVPLARLASNVITNNYTNPTFNGALSVVNGNTSFSITPGYLFATASNNCVTLDIPGFGNKVAIWDNLYVSDNVYSAGVQLTSDRNLKENFAAVDAKTMLEKVASLPVTQWNYKKEGAAEKHVGPMAQDFHAAFGLNGDDDKHISAVDESGVALAAIQGLNEKLKEKDVEIAELKKSVAELRKIVERLAPTK